MNFILEAFSPADGMAIVRNEQHLRLIRPPYKQTNTVELPENAIQDAVLNHGFYVSGGQFNSWKSIIVFLNQQLAEYRENQGRPMSEEFNNVEMLEMAPLEILEGFLFKVENELIPQSQYEHAENFLLALLESNATQKHPCLKDQSAKLLKQIQHVENAKTNPNEVFANHYSPFKSLARKNLTEKANSIASFIKQSHGFFGAPA